jgi:uncharacterized protein YkwD
VTRRGILISVAAPFAACVTIGASASAAVAPQTPVAAGGQYAVAASLSSPRAHGASTRTRRKSSSCINTHKRSSKRSAGCKAAGRRVPARAPHAKRPRPTSTKVTAPAVEAAPTAAGIIAKVLATPCQNTQLIPEPGNLALVRAAVLCLINTERAQNGREPLTPDAQLEQAAEGHGREMLSLNYFDHIAPSGLTPVQRIRTTGYIPNSEVGYVIGENLAWGTLTLATPQAIVNAWIASPEHLANILEGKYRDTGIDVEPEVPQALAEGVAGALYTQEFGVIVR